MKKLLVVCEPRYNPEKKCSVNLAMNEILKEYHQSFDEIHCLCPGDFFIEGEKGQDDVIYHVSERYKGSRLRKLAYQFRPDKSFIRRIIIDNKIQYVQIRIPSFFSLPLYNCIRSMPLTITTYVAGDVEESIKHVFSKLPFVNFISRYLEKQQQSIIKNTLVVTTGPVLATKYKYLNSNIHAFFSTTHNDVKVKADFSSKTELLKIVFIGRIDPAKRLEDILVACQLLRKENIPFLFNVIGDGPSLAKIKRMSEVYNIDDSIIFRGYIEERNLIDDILLNSDVIVLPSLTEGTPKVLPEAMSRGVIPIAIKDVGSNNYIVDNNGNGFLVPPRSPLEIFNAFNTIINDPILKIKMIESCYSYAKERTAKNEMNKLWQFVFTNS